MRSYCWHLRVEPGRTWIENEHAIALANSNPIADGHTIIFPRKHVGTIYDLTQLEQDAARLLTGLTPDGFRIGFNHVMHDGVTTPCRRTCHAQYMTAVADQWLIDSPLCPERPQRKRRARR